MSTNTFGCGAAACATLTLILGGAASANEDSVGQIEHIDGVAMINQGGEYKPAKAGMQLHELDILLVMEDGNAEILFKDGCKHRMQGPQMLDVRAESVCAAPSDIVANAADASEATRAKLEEQSTAQLGADFGSDDQTNISEVASQKSFGSGSASTPQGVSPTGGSTAGTAGGSTAVGASTAGTFGVSTAGTLGTISTATVVTGVAGTLGVGALAYTVSETTNDGESVGNRLRRESAAISERLDDVQLAPAPGLSNGLSSLLIR